MRERRRAFHIPTLVLVTGAALSLAACNGNDDHDDHDDHADLGWVEIETRGTPPTLLAEWDDHDGWADGEGNPIDTLPTPVQTEVGDLEPFEAFGPRASLSVRFFDPDGDEIEMGTLDQDDDTGERECTEYSVRYFAIDDETDVIAWPVTTHPDSDTGSAQFTEVSDGEDETELVGIFHCDHVHIYPQEAGEVEVEFVLWHVDHGDGYTDPLTIAVEAAD